MDFVLPEELEVMHQPLRLRIVTLLFRHRDLAFGELRDALAVTGGNLSSHLQRLEEGGVVAQRRTFGKDGFAARVALTADGDVRFRRYLQALRDYLTTQPS